jgi:hypothetical protein
MAGISLRSLAAFRLNFQIQTFFNFEDFSAQFNWGLCGGWDIGRDSLFFGCAASILNSFGGT